MEDDFEIERGIERDLEREPFNPRRRQRIPVLDPNGTLRKRFERGERVRLPDGETGVVDHIDGDDVHVAQPQKTVGRGPWIYSAANGGLEVLP